jgi:hypothetical protein
VFAAFVLLVLLIVAAPAAMFGAGTMTDGILAVLAAGALGIVAATIRPGEAVHFTKMVRPMIVWLLLIPAAWMVVQLIPMPFATLAHPMWASAAEALNTPIARHISVDIGATLIGLVRYLTVVAILLVATAVTMDRNRAEWALNWLAGVTSATAAILIALHLAAVAAPAAEAALNAAAALGVVITAAATIKSIERYETRRNRMDGSPAGLARSLAPSLSAFALCWLAVILAAPMQVAFAAGCGFATVLLIVIARRFALGSLAATALATLAIITAAAIVVGGSKVEGSNPTLRFAAQASPFEVSMTERMIADNFVGSGVGTFRALAQIYREDSDGAVHAMAPTSAAQMAIEMGRLAPWVAVLMSMAITGLLLRAAMRRGRDSFYATAAAGATLTLTVEAFVDASLLTSVIALLAAAFLGLGLAQSASRTAQ